MGWDTEGAATSRGVAPKAGVLRQSIGIETKGGAFTVLIKRGTPVPARCSETFTTADDYQTSIQIRVFQGNHRKAARNKMLGIFEMHGFAGAPPG